MSGRSVAGRWRAAAVALLGLWVIAAPGAAGGTIAGSGTRSSPPASVQAAVVRRVVDGDTIDVRVGGANRRVRLLQVDTPEVYGATECYGPQASAALRRLLPAGTPVTLYTDPGLDRTDAYGRLLRYVFRGSLNVDAWLVSNGYAAPYFYRGDRGRYATMLERTAKAAIAARRGLWGACPRARYDPDAALDTGPAAGAAGAGASAPGAGVVAAPPRAFICVRACGRAPARGRLRASADA